MLLRHFVGIRYGSHRKEHFPGTNVGLSTEESTVNSQVWALLPLNSHSRGRKKIYKQLHAIIRGRTHDGETYSGVRAGTAGHLGGVIQRETPAGCPHSRHRGRPCLASWEVCQVDEEGRAPGRGNSIFEATRAYGACSERRSPGWAQAAGGAAGQD